MAIFYTRQCIVDPQGLSGTYSTISAAIAGAVAGGASDATQNYWQVLVAPGVYTENVVQPGGIQVRGCGRMTVVRGTYDIQSGSELSDLYITQIATSSYTLGIRHTATNNTTYVKNVIVDNLQSANSTVNAVEVSGTGTGTSRIIGGFYYAQNTITGSAPLAKAVVIRLLSDFVGVVEFYGGIHLKTSLGGATGSAEAICLLNQQTARAIGGYAHVIGDWSSPYSGSGTALDPVLLDNANTLNPGASMDVACWNPAGKVPTIRTAFVGPGDARMHCRYIHSIRAEGEYTQVSGGTVFDVQPSLTLGHIPTGADVAPTGTVAYVV